MLHDPSAVVASPSAALAALLPVTPTTQRTFATTADVGAFVRVYQGGAGVLVPVAMRVTIVDGHDRIAFSREHALDPQSFSQHRAADFFLQLPLATLSPGPYLLQITAETTSGSPAKQQVRFTVR